jgi:PPOX class probable FMN-dependent enzyme
MFRDLVTSVRELQDLLGEPSELAIRKELSALDEHFRTFIARSPFLLLASAGASGRCDVSPKGDAPGFVRVLDDKHLVIPDRPGNRRFDGMRNILENPHVGLIFLIPGREDTLRVNGRAWITRDPELLEAVTAMGKRPPLAIGVEVEQCFLHCAKAFKRSHLWQPEHWPDAATVPSPARMYWDQAKPTGKSVEDVERDLQESYRTRLY